MNAKPKPAEHNVAAKLAAGLRKWAYAARTTAMQRIMKSAADFLEQQAKK
jgi:hypothetical protein